MAGSHTWVCLGEIISPYPLVKTNIAIAGISPFSIGSIHHLHFGSIFQPAMLAYQSVLIFRGLIRKSTYCITGFPGPHLVDSVETHWNPKENLLQSLDPRSTQCMVYIYLEPKWPHILEDLTHNMVPVNPPKKRSVGFIGTYTFWLCLW